MNSRIGLQKSFRRREASEYLVSFKAKRKVHEKLFHIIRCRLTVTWGGRRKLILKRRGEVAAWQTPGAYILGKVGLLKGTTEEGGGK